MAHPEWTMLHPKMTLAHLGMLPSFLSESSPDKAAAQLDRWYVGGFHPQPGFRLTDNDNLLYPGDPPMRPVAKTRLRDEIVLIYPFSYVAVVQPDRTFEVSRMD